MPVESIEVRDLPAQHTAAVRHQISMSETSHIPEWLQQTLDAVRAAGLEPAGMPFVRTFSFDGGQMDIEVGWPVPAPFTAAGDVHPSELPAGPAAVAVYLGPYTQISGAYDAAERWCADNGHEIAGAPWESYLNGPGDEPDSAKWRTDVHFPLAP
jgi:effector-binding domain-containing protein